MPASTNNFRKVSGTIHLWLGWITAVFLTIVCLTGTIFVFHNEIDKALYPEYYQVKPSGSPLSIDSLLTIVKDKSRGKITSFRISDAKEDAWTFNVTNKDNTPKGAKKKGGKEDKNEKTKAFYVNPYTGEITFSGSTPASSFFREVEDIHRFFFLSKPVGQVIAGIMSLSFVVIIFSGIIIWLPRKIKQWKDGFKIKFKAHWKRINYDLHRALGIFVFPVLLLCALTGPNWSFEGYRAGLSKVLGAEVFKGKKEKPARVVADTSTAMTKKISYAEVLDIANKRLPDNGLTIVSLPKDSLEAISVSKIRNGWHQLNVTDKIQINPYNGQIVKTELFQNLHFGAKIAALVKSIHVGEFYGTISKSIYFIACLLASSLPLTGILIWNNKRRKKKPSLAKKGI